MLTLANKGKFENSETYTTRVAQDVAELLVVVFVDDIRNQECRFTVWEGLSLRWYNAALNDPQLAEGLLNRVGIAIVACVISTVTGSSSRSLGSETSSAL